MDYLSANSHRIGLSYFFGSSGLDSNLTEGKNMLSLCLQPQSYRQHPMNLFIPQCSLQHQTMISSSLVCPTVTVLVSFVVQLLRVIPFLFQSIPILLISYMVTPFIC